MQELPVKIRSIVQLTHDVIQIVTDKPQGFHFKPGQATEVSILKEGWEHTKRPFTFSSLPENDSLQFTIKTYPAHLGVTHELLKLNKGDELMLREVFGTIMYKGEGVFIAGGAGVTPFISIFRCLEQKKETGNNKLIFANKTKADIILEEEFKKILNKNFINILSEEKTEEYAYGRITEDFLKMHISDLTKVFYICGPPPMIEAVEKQLIHLQINEKLIVKEVF